MEADKISKDKIKRRVATAAEVLQAAIANAEKQSFEAGDILKKMSAEKVRDEKMAAAYARLAL